MKSHLRELQAMKRWSWYHTGERFKHPALPANDSSRWLTYHQASTAIAGRNVGYGFAADDGLVGIDLDGCIKDGFISPVAAHILTLCGGSYAEVSISGRGIKVWTYGSKHLLQCNYDVEGQKVEVYNRNKWFMFTGKMLANHQPEITSGQPAINWIESYGEKRRLPTPYSSIQSDDACIAECNRWGGAVSGRNGHGTTFSLACKLVRMGQNEDGVYSLLKQYHNPMCQPAWSDTELRHKAKQAFEKSR